MIRIAIAEDNEMHMQELISNLNRYAEESHCEITIAQFRNGIDLVEYLSPDLRPADPGHWPARHRRHERSQKDPGNRPDGDHHVFDQYGSVRHRGIRGGALDYVLKPINYYALSMKLRRIFHTILSRGQKVILVNTREEKLRIDVQEIQYIEIDSHAITIHTETGTYTTSGTLGSIEQQLPERGFARCNRCFLVNLQHIRAVKGDTVFVGGAESPAMQLIYYTLLWGFGALWLWVCCDQPPAGAVYVAGFAYAMQHICYAIHGIVLVLSGNWPSVLQILITCATYFLMWFFFRKDIVRQDYRRLSLVQLAANTVLLLLVSIAFSIVITTMEEPGEVRTILFLRIYDILCCFFVFYSMTNQQRWFTACQENQALQQLWHLKQDQLEREKESVRQINQKSHDLKYQIEALRTELKKSKMESCLEGLEQSLETYDSNVKTGNEALDTILTTSSMNCRANQITWLCVADGKPLAFMDVIDLYTMLGNAVDHAIECLKTISQPEKRVLSITIYRRSQFAVIQIENYCERELEFRDGLPVTTKADREYHGFGMKSIRSIVEKYDGSMTASLEDHIFLLNILLPIP